VTQPEESQIAGFCFQHQIKRWQTTTSFEELNCIVDNNEIGVLAGAWWENAAIVIATRQQVRFAALTAQMHFWTKVIGPGCQG
jgi:hypothetical protein